jgi:hypothetical protein
MTLQVLGGVNSPCGWYRVRGQSPSTGGQDHTHTHTLTHYLQLCVGDKGAADNNGMQDWAGDYKGEGGEWVVNNSGIRQKADKPAGQRV